MNEKNKLIKSKKTFNKGDKIINFPLRLTKELHQRISDEASKANTSKHKYILDCIEYRISIEKGL